VDGTCLRATVPAISWTVFTLRAELGGDHV
jgi:hypothetical protein